jgi:serine/threonine-protein kinase
VYSLAVVAYHMLTGETPFLAANTPAMLVKHVSERPRPIRDRRPDLPPHLAVAIDRALAKRPEDRFADAAEFRDAVVSGSSASSAAAANAVRPSSAPGAALTPRVPEQLPGGAGDSIGSAAHRPFPMPPPHLHGRELREWIRAQRRVAASQQLQAGGSVVMAMNDPALWTQLQRFEDRPLEERVTAFRRSVGAWLTWTAIFFGLNVMMHGPGPWFLLPSGFMFLKTLRRGSSIWSDGIGPIDAFTKGINKRLRDDRQRGGGAPDARVHVAPAAPSQTPEQAAALLAPADVLAGRFGDAVRRAAADRLLMRDIAASLGPIERTMIPDVLPTIDALAERVGSVASTLHRLDADVSGTSLGALDARIASLQTEPETADRERRLTLLQRQRSSLRDLLERRQSLASQLESASLMLQNLKLDLLKLRSSGLGTAIHDQVSATQEARALSREIGHVVDAADDLRKL